MLCRPRAPDLLEKLLPRHKMSRVPEEHFDHSKLNSGEENLGAIGMKGSPIRDVNREVGGHDRSRFSRALNSTKGGSQPSQELLNSGWLCQEVVRPGIQRKHDVGLIGNFGHHEDRYVGLGSQLSYQLDGVQWGRVDEDGIAPMIAQIRDRLPHGLDRVHS